MVVPVPGYAKKKSKYFKRLADGKIHTGALQFSEIKGYVIRSESGLQHGCMHGHCVCVGVGGGCVYQS